MDTLEEFNEIPWIRSNVEGNSPWRPESVQGKTLGYRAATEEDGEWSAPYYPCHDRVRDFVAWTITYSVPFFGGGQTAGAVEAK